MNKKHKIIAAIGLTAVFAAGIATISKGNLAFAAEETYVVEGIKMYADYQAASEEESHRYYVTDYNTKKNRLVVTADDDTDAKDFTLTFTTDLSFKINYNGERFLGAGSGNSFTQTETAWTIGNGIVYDTRTIAFNYNSGSIIVVPYITANTIASEKYSSNYTIMKLIIPEDTCTGIDRTSELSNRVWNLLYNTYSN